MSKESFFVPDELSQSIKNKLELLHEALEKDENPENQIAFRMMAGKGSFDPHEGSSFQVIVELCVKEEYFLEDGVINILTELPHESEPYKIIPPDSEL